MGGGLGPAEGVEPIAAAALVAGVAAVCLWLLFRRGSMLDRARDGAEAMDARRDEGGEAEPPLRRRRGASDR